MNEAHEKTGCGGWRQYGPPNVTSCVFGKTFMAAYYVRPREEVSSNNDWHMGNIVINILANTCNWKLCLINIFLFHQ